jgi:hypothetical protein
MEENENLDAGSAQKQGRPTFLTVLCILTFVGSGLGLLGGLFGLLGLGFLSSLSASVEGDMLWAVIALVSSALCLFGAIQMWGLKKMGFSLYLVGSVLAIVTYIMSAVNASSRMTSLTDNMNRYSSQMGNEVTAQNEMAANAVGSVASGFAWGGAIFYSLVAIAFVIMYSANKKHLVN